MARSSKRKSADSAGYSSHVGGMSWRVILLGLLLLLTFSPFLNRLNPNWLFLLGVIPAIILAQAASRFSHALALNRERAQESRRRGGKAVIGAPPKREAFEQAKQQAQAKGKAMIDKYLLGFDLESGDPLWITDEEICGHAAVFAKTGVGKTLWLESMMFQQMSRGRASGCTFIDAKRDSTTLAHVIMMALITGRIEDLIVIDPFDPVHAYNFCLTSQRPDVKARKVLRAGLPITSDQSVTKHYDRLAADSIYRMVRAMESFGAAWSIRDIAVAFSAFNLAYPQLRSMLNKIGAKQALVELGHLASSYRTSKGTLDYARFTENVRGISAELHAISNSEMGKMFCTNYSDLVLSDAIMQGKIIYYMLPRLEEAESAARMVKVLREDLEVSIGEITSSNSLRLEDPHLLIIDEGSSTFGPTWANLFELARKGRFALLFGAQSTGSLTDSAMGLSQAFYERVMANVNLKVMMRVGDNRTAEDMAKWIGKISTFKKTIRAGQDSIKDASNSDTSSDQVRGVQGGRTVSWSESETDLVSSEELKHEMSAEKGLAWFDLGDGKIRKGRTLWVDAEVPANFNARKFLVRHEKVERDEIGLADWVDEQILSHEEMSQQAPVSRSAVNKTATSASSAVNDSSKQVASGKKTGPFRLNVLPGGSKRKPGVETPITPSASNDKNLQNGSGAKGAKVPTGKFLKPPDRIGPNEPEMLNFESGSKNR